MQAMSVLELSYCNGHSKDTPCLFHSNCSHHDSCILKLNFEVIRHVDCIPIPLLSETVPSENPVKRAACAD